MTFNTFTSNLAEFITKNKDFVDSNQKSINKAKKRILIIFLAIITFAILGNFVCNYFSKILGGGNLFSFLGIMIGGNLVLKLTNNYFSKTQPTNLPPFISTSFCFLFPSIKRNSIVKSIFYLFCFFILFPRIIFRQ